MIGMVRLFWHGTVGTGWASLLCKVPNSPAGTNASGQLGQGDTTARGGTAGTMGDSLPTVDLGKGLTARSLALGASHTCALVADVSSNLSVKCWGDNSHGQLGVGDSANRGAQSGEMGDALPAVDFGSRTPTAVAAGGNSTCAVLSDSNAVCWGEPWQGHFSWWRVMVMECNAMHNAP